MADIRVGKGKGAEFPSGEGPRVSSTLAHNVGMVSDVVQKITLHYEATDLSGRCTIGATGATAKGVFRTR
ncbi:MAG: hypothetical protein K1000chlam3_01186 [Chlamydiae bacterium]|nr:hypothetical protein [Chlamydiota bacterium]